MVMITECWIREHRTRECQSYQYLTGLSTAALHQYQTHSQGRPTQCTSAVTTSLNLALLFLAFDNCCIATAAIFYQNNQPPIYKSSHQQVVLPVAHSPRSNRRHCQWLAASQSGLCRPCQTLDKHDWLRSSDEFLATFIME